MSELLEIHEVRHRYAEEGWELKVAGFQVRAGEIVGIIGPNGSGKSTLLRIAAGALRPLAGHVLLEGVDLAHMERRWIARRLGYLPQDVESQFDYSVREVVAMGRYAHLRGLGALTSSDLDVVNWSLEATDTARLEERRLSHLSGGERQRVFLASVLAQEPEVLLLDEPTKALDIHQQVRFFKLLRKLAQGGMGMAVVTHDLNLAALYCDRVLLLSGGAPACEGTTDDVMRSDLLAKVYGPEIVVSAHPQSGRTIVLPSDVREGENR